MLIFSELRMRIRRVQSSEEYKGKRWIYTNCVNTLTLPQPTNPIMYLNEKLKTNVAIYITIKLFIIFFYKELQKNHQDKIK